MVITDSFWGNIFKGNKKGDEGTKLILKKTPLFEVLSDKELTVIERILHRRKYDENEAIFRQGDTGAGMYIIETGNVNISHELTGRIIVKLGAGEIFGEISLINDSPRSASAYADVRSNILFFSQADLNNLTDRDPKLGARIIKRLASILGHRLVASNEQIGQLKRELNK